MFRSKAKRAAVAYQALRKLGEIDARQELAASGVSKHRMQALYPETEFEAIVARLIERMPDLPTCEFIEQLDNLHFIARRMMPILAKTAVEGKLPFEVWDLPDEDPRDDLRRAIELRVTEDPTLETLAVNKFLQFPGPTVIADCVWWAWWIMARRSNVSRDLVGEADKLMLIVDKLFELR